MKPLCSLTLTLALALTSSAAAADILPAGMKHIPIEVSFTNDGKSLLVAFPADCSPMGEATNYDALDLSAPREPYKFCGDKSAVYALDEGSFTRQEAKEKPMAWRRSGFIVPELEATAPPERAKLFASNAHIHQIGYTFPPFALIDDKMPLKAVRETVVVKGNKAEQVALTYVYIDGSEEKHTYVPGKRPQPLRSEARDWMKGLVDAAAAQNSPAQPPTASPTGSVMPASVPPASPPPASSPKAKSSSGGCSSAPGGASSGSAGAFFLLGLLAANRRRRG